MRAINRAVAVGIGMLVCAGAAHGAESIVAQWRFSPENLALLPNAWGPAEGPVTIDPETGAGVMLAQIYASGNYNQIQTSLNSTLSAPDDGTYSLLNVVNESTQGNQFVLTFDPVSVEGLKLTLDVTGSSHRPVGALISANGVDYFPPSVGPGSVLPNANWYRGVFNFADNAEIEGATTLFIRIDIGGASQHFQAYRFDNITIKIDIPSDLNGDSCVDTADLGLLLTQFGNAGADADINGDGVVDTADLGILLGAFGSSCQ